MEDLKLEYKTIAQISEMNDQQCIQYLLQQWSLSSPVIEGKPRFQNDIWWLTEVTDLAGNPLEFPISDLPDRRKSLQRGVFIGPSLPTVKGQDVRSSFFFSLSPQAERNKKQNPLSIKAKPLTTIPQDLVYPRADGGIDLDETLCRGYVTQKHSDLMEQLGEREQRLRDLEVTAQDLATRNAETASDVASKRKETQDLDKEIKAAATERDRFRAELETESKCKQEEIEGCDPN